MFSYEKFEELCSKTGASPYQVSQDTGIATSTLTCWKQGKYIPKVDKLLKIADYFGVGIEDFFLENDDEEDEEGKSDDGIV